jgi:hypothetical protein
MPHSLPKIPILMYHSALNVAERGKKQRSANPAYCLPVNQFQEQMEYIHKNGYKTLHLDQLLLPSTSLISKKVIINPPHTLALTHQGRGLYYFPSLECRRLAGERRG